MRANYRLWSCWPYAGEAKPPTNSVEPLAGSWPMYYLKRGKHGNFTDLWRNPVKLYIKNPNDIVYLDSNLAACR